MPLQVWNFDFLNQTQGQVYGNASAAYETLQPQQNNSVFLGILVQAAQNNIQPLNITVNGEQCTMQLVNNITGVLPSFGCAMPDMYYCFQSRETEETGFLEKDRGAESKMIQYSFEGPNSMYTCLSVVQLCLFAAPDPLSTSASGISRAESADQPVSITNGQVRLLLVHAAAFHERTVELPVAQ